MNLHGQNRHRFIVILIAIAILLLTACQPGAATTAPIQPPAQPTATQPPAAQPAATATLTAQPSTPVVNGMASLTLDTSGLAQHVNIEVLEAVPLSASGPVWEAAPQRVRLTLDGYPISNHMHKPQITLYPVAEMPAYNENTAKIAADLQDLLQTQQAGDRLPFLPLFNAAQVIRAQVQYLDFKNGKGVRFLTQFDQAPIPINNYELFYTFQGLTSDGKYYVSAVLPVNMPDLPVDTTVSSEQAQQMNDWQAYLAKVVEKLNQQPANSFTPDLAKLDAMISSIEVK